MRGYTQLTHEERYQIYILKKAEYARRRLLSFWGVASRLSVGSCAGIGV